MHDHHNLYMYLRAYLHNGGPPDLLGLLRYENEEEHGLALWPVYQKEAARECVALLRHVQGVYYELIACHPELIEDA
jgi:hypothetical protein